MSNFQLVTTKHFNGAEFDCYRDTEQQDTQDFWATREQIGQALDYVQPEVAITKIHQRYPERLDKFSTVTKLVRVEGDRTVTREVTVYNFLGLLEICRRSNQPKADAVMDFLYNIADEIRRTGSYNSQAQSPEFHKAQELISEQRNLEQRINFWRDILHNIKACKDNIPAVSSIFFDYPFAQDDKDDLALLKDILKLAIKLAENKTCSLMKKQRLISSLIRL